MSETKFFVDEEYEDYKYSSTLPHSCYAALSHTTAFVNIISGHIYTVKQTMSDYYYIHSFDLTNSLKRLKGPPGGPGITGNNVFRGKLHGLTEPKIGQPDPGSGTRH